MGATISLSFDCFSILIRVSKTRISIFFVFEGPTISLSFDLIVDSDSKTRFRFLVRLFVVFYLEFSVVATISFTGFFY